MLKFAPVLIATLFAPAAWADAPRVVADIAPVHSLVAQVMKGVGTPDLLIEPTASPHSYALRPSQAAALEAADIVVTTSEILTPWLMGPVSSLASDALVLEVMTLEGSVHHDMRGDEDDHDHGHDHSGETGDDDLDPHGWLDPENATLWIGAIEAGLSAVDPENADLYSANALKAVLDLTAMSTRIDAQMSAVKSQPFMVLHDGFQYFDRRFGPEFEGSIALGDAAAPSPKRIANARDQLREHAVVCVFTEPQQSERLVDVVIEGTDTKIGELDAMGARLSPGPDLYFELLQGLADSFAECLEK
jgi:zinc transport system substrate-binding protein